MATLCRILESPIDLDGAIRSVVGPDRGALALFSGLVRDHHEGRRVVRLEYHAYVEMAEQVLRDVAREAAERFGTENVAILHRIGRLEIGDVSVLVAVASAHRREALLACSFAIERVKEIAPIWKKEFYLDGSAWIEGRDACGAAPKPAEGAS